MRSVIRRLFFVAGVMAAGFYLGWNAGWIWHGKFAPSIMLELLGLPAPTTGFTRSWLALLSGRVVQSLCWNPLALPLSALLAATALFLCVRMLKGERLILPRAMARCWMALLLLAWAVKLASGPAWW